MNGRAIKILKSAIPVSSDYLPIYNLKFLPDNPRVYACTYARPDFEDLTEDEQQKYIFDKLCQEPSVKNLKPDIKLHGGLIENILVRHDTNHVIEGNSRLAVFRLLNDEQPEGEWDYIPCDIVSSLSEREQVAFLHQIHVKGKTTWSAYEKANFAYVRKERGWSVNQIAEQFGESVGTIRTRVKIIETLKENDDHNLSHFSYYEVLVRNKEISKGCQEHSELRKILLKGIKVQGLGQETEDSEFTAQELRDKLPVILKKPKVLKKYIDGKVDLDEGYRLARISKVEENVKQANTLVEDISRSEISKLELSDFNSFRYSTKRLSKSVERITKMVKSVGDK